MSLKIDETPTSVFLKYADFAEIFCKDVANELLDNFRINDYTINLIDQHQLPCKAIYNLRLVELEILNTYIETNLANSFIKPSKSFADTSIFFFKKLDRNLWLCVNNKSFDNLIIKNEYILPLLT